MSKVTKEQAMYVDASRLSYAKPHGACCDRCALMLPKPSKDCGVIGEPVDRKKGVCGLYIHGLPILKSAHELVTKDEAGYVEGRGVPSHCGDCEYYGGDENDGPCEKVEGTVENGGCCVLWEYDSTYKFKMMKSEK